MRLREIRYQKGEHKTILKTTLQLRDEELSRIRGMRNIKLLLSCPKIRNPVMFELKNAEGGEKSAGVLMSMAVEEDLFHGLMNPGLRIKFASESGSASFAVDRIGPARLSDLYGPLAETLC